MSSENAIAEYWSAAAPAFDEEPDHGLRDARTRRAWERRLADWMPPRPAVDVLDVGCGTGSLTVLLAGAGHRVTGVDLAPGMVAAARAKIAAAGLSAAFVVGDAAAPPVGVRRFDVVLSRHLLWTLPDPQAALRGWLARLRPGGRLVLIEGRWRQPADAGAVGAGVAAPYAGEHRLPWQGGVTARELTSAVAPLVSEVRVESLSEDGELWGGEVDDERYALLALA
ncbi:class I SAM-dependent methyltransferase [Streptomyces sp. 4N509B]|uniref:class I SAM-dependent methyltransferase n=1 Tax=Streptomyces sp. 4N509B TaxID=3457413 RepID=UPI003FD43145